MGQLEDKIEDLEEENKILKEVRDDLMEENERLRKQAREFKIMADLILWKRRR